MIENTRTSGSPTPPLAALGFVEALIARFVAVIRQASSRSSKTSSGSASSSRTLTQAEEFVAQPAS